MTRAGRARSPVEGVWLGVQLFLLSPAILSAADRSNSERVLKGAGRLLGEFRLLVSHVGEFAE